MAEDETEGPSVYRVPATVQDMLPPKQSSLITEAANFLRSHWDEMKPYYECLTGEKQSRHEAHDIDETVAVLEVQRIATQNGFAFLGSVPTAALRRALRYGWKRNTGIPMRLLKAQYKQLQIEHRR